MKRRARALACAFLLIAVAASAQRAATVSVEVPEFDPASLEPAVAEQLGALRQHVDGVIAGGGDAAAVAEVVGELGRHYHAYELVEPAAACSGRPVC